MITGAGCRSEGLRVSPGRLCCGSISSTTAWMRAANCACILPGPRNLPECGQPHAGGCRPSQRSGAVDRHRYPDKRRTTPEMASMVETCSGVAHTEGWGEVLLAAAGEILRSPGMWRTRNSTQYFRTAVSAWVNGPGPGAPYVAARRIKRQYGVEPGRNTGRPAGSCERSATRGLDDRLRRKHEGSRFPPSGGRTTIGFPTRITAAMP